MAVFGAILGPMLGATAHVVGIRTTFLVVTGVALALAAAAALNPAAPVERQQPGALRRALRDRSFVGGLWLNTLPALLFGTIALLVPLTLDAGGFTPFAIGAVFLGAGLLEAGLNPVIGRVSDRIGRFRPARAALAASVVVAVGLAFASHPPRRGARVPCVPRVRELLHPRDGARLRSRRGCGPLAGSRVRRDELRLGARQPHRSRARGCSADRWGDPVPYALGAALCLLTLLAVQVVARSGRPAAGRPPAPADRDRERPGTVAPQARAVQPRTATSWSLILSIANSAQPTLTETADSPPATRSCTRERESFQNPDPHRVRAAGRELREPPAPGSTLVEVDQMEHQPVVLAVQVESTTPAPSTSSGMSSWAAQRTTLANSRPWSEWWCRAKQRSTSAARYAVRSGTGGSSFPTRRHGTRRRHPAFSGG